MNKFKLGNKVTCNYISACEGQPELIGEITEVIEKDSAYRYKVHFDGFSLHSDEGDLNIYETSK